ncbi:MAG TPA: glycosyltransferase family 4 protein [Chloroflexi bacterium]|nr:glycosyltransferase family 4 protein [Chloroflexota bacterium]
MTPAPPSLHVAVNGWMAGRLTSGSGQYLDHLLDWLPRLAPDMQISLLLPIHPALDTMTPAAVYARWPSVACIPVALPPLPENLAKLWWEQVAAPRAARRARADLYWVPYWAGPFWTPLPVVITVHDLIPLLLPAYRGRLTQRAYTRLVAWSARRATAIITVSEAAARDIIAHLRVAPARVHVVHHGPNQEGAPPPTAADCARVRQRYALPERFFLYLGGFDVRKNLAGVIAGYARYLARGGDPMVKLVLAGALPAADTDFFPDPRRLAQAAGCADHVHYCGWVEEADKPALYALATAFIFPSLYEGFGMMVLEAMQAGTPVVTSGK